MRQIAISPLLAATLALPASAQLVITGKVTSADKTPVEGAQVYINDVGVATFTMPDGSYHVVVPSDKTKGQLTNLRVRALQFTPAAQVVTLSPGRQTVNYTVVKDTVRERLLEELNAVKRAYASEPSRPATKVAQGGAEPARVPFATARAVEIPVAATADPFNRYLFQPEQVMRYQDALGLSEDQRTKLQSAMEEAQKRAVQVQWALALENEKLQKALDKPVVDEKETIGAMDRIVGVEREMKRAQLELLVKIKNTLTEEQQVRLRRLRGFDD